MAESISTLMTLVVSFFLFSSFCLNSGQITYNVILFSVVEFTESSLTYSTHLLEVASTQIYYTASLSLSHNYGLYVRNVEQNRKEKNICPGLIRMYKEIREKVRT